MFLNGVLINFLKNVIQYINGAQVVTVVKNPPANAGDLRDTDSILTWGKIPWRRKWQPTLVFLPREFHGLRSLAGYSPLGHKQSDTTEAN